jgi:hypothetical protein
MPLLSATGRKSTTLAPALPIFLAPLSNYVCFRRGQFSILAGSPGTGKSVVATNIAIQSPLVPTLFFSADSDEFTVRMRALAISTGAKLDDVEKNTKDSTWVEHYNNDVLPSINHVDWCFRSDIDLDFIVKRINAYGEIRGEAPHLVVVDNLTNSVNDTDNEYSELRTTCRDLQVIARETGAHILALHHVKGIHEQAEKRATPISLGSLQYNLGKIPEIVIGINSPSDGVLNCSVPKNRAGRAGVEFYLDMDLSRATVNGFVR